MWENLVISYSYYSGNFDVCLPRTGKESNHIIFRVFSIFGIIFYLKINDDSALTSTNARCSTNTPVMNDRIIIEGAELLGARQYEPR